MNVNFAERALASLPLSGIALLLLGLLALSAFIGTRIRRGWAARWGETRQDKTFDNFILSGLMGLLALLMGFTFSMAAQQYDRRNLRVSEEANAIHAAYLMAQTFEEPQRGRLQDLLRAYVDIRLTLAGQLDRNTQMALWRRSEALQRQIWENWREATRRVGGSPNIYLDPAFDALTVGSARESARLSHIPPRVILFLIAYMMILSVVVGFQSPATTRHAMAGALLLLLTLSTTLILDLDRPTEGAIRESQRPMESLRERLAVTR